MSLVLNKVLEATLVPYSYGRAHRRTAEWETRPLTENEIAKLHDKFVVQVAANRDIVRDEDESYLGYAFYVSGNAPEPLPEDRFINYVRVANAYFKRRRNAGEIVMAPYQVDNVAVKQMYGKIDNVGPSVDAYIRLDGDPWDRMYFDSEWMSGNYGSMSARCSRSLINSTFVSPSALGFSESAASMAQLLRESNVEEGGLICGTIADAKDGELDMLTTLAELPETIRSVLLIISKLKEMYVAVKKREVQLTKLNANSLKALRIKFAKQRETVEQSIRRLELTPVSGLRPYEASLHRKELRKLELLRSRLKTQETKQVKALLMELADKCASLWMAWRYEIQPLLYTADDALEAVSRLYADYISTRGKSILYPDVLPVLPEGWTVMGSSEVSVEHKCYVKSRYKIENDLANNQFKVLGSNLARTAWEIISKSFVVDWFINIGDILVATFSMDNSIEQKMSYSWKTVGGNVYIHEETGARVFSSYSCYRRTIIVNPFDYTFLTFENGLNFKREMDALAMFWGGLRPHLRSRK